MRYTEQFRKDGGFLMELKQLICFRRVAELEHLTKAANELYMSQSRLSHVIAELEAEIGVQLFDREGRGIKLNPCGKLFYRNVLDIMFQIEDSTKKVREFEKRQSTQMTIATNTSTYMPGLLQFIQKALPGMVIRQYSAERRKLIRMLIDGEIDFTICCPMLTEEPDLTSHLLHTERPVVIYPQDHWLKDYDTISVPELKDERFINVGVGYGIRDVQDMYFNKIRMFPDIAIETTDTQSIYTYVDRGLGIAVAPESMTLQHPTFCHRYTDLAVDAVATIGLTWRNNHYASESWKMFMETIKMYFMDLKQRNEDQLNKY